MNWGKNRQGIARPVIHLVWLIVFVVRIPSGSASISFFVDEASWLSAVQNVENFAFTPENIALANEVTVAPPAPGGAETDLGSPLSFDGSNTGLSRSFQLTALEAGATFRYNDQNLLAIPDYLSVGDVDVFEDDDWAVSITGGASVYAFAVRLWDNDDNTNEVFSVLDTNGMSAGDFFSIPAGNEVFLGVLSSQPIGTIRFDDESSGDDIFLRSVSFAVPEPAAGCFLLASMTILLARSTRRIR